MRPAPAPHSGEAAAVGGGVTTTASRVLAEAFRTDPWARYVLGAPGGERAAALARIMRVPVHVAAERGGLVVRRDATGTATAVSTWLPLAQRRTGLADVRRAGALLLPLLVGPATMRRLTRDESDLDKVMGGLLEGERDVGGVEHDAYLWVLGAARAARGRGHGRAAVEQTCTEAVARGFRRLVLNTDNPDNVALYRRLGFALAGTAARPSGLRAHILVRAL